MTRTGNGPAPLALDPRTYARGLSCVHCGLCLPACPTYTTNFNEADSPRGRIQLMLAISDDTIQPSPSAVEHLNLCLDCRACETACPSGVVYHELIEETRARLASRERPSLGAKLLRWVFLNIFTHPLRLKLTLLPARILQKLGVYPLLRKSGLLRLLPAKLAKMEQMLPSHGDLWPQRLGAFHKATGTRKTAVSFLEGCVGGVMFADVNRKAVELLQACGAEVAVSREQTCCGAIHHHNADHHTAAEYARRNIDALMPQGHEPDYIVSTIAGCGAMLRDYDLLLRDDPAYADRAKRFVAKVRDVSEVLLELGLPAITQRIDAKVTYHDACHLVHAQRVAAAPRQLLAKIPGLVVVPLPESDMCCGAAGTYNLTQPEMATALGQRKLSAIASTTAPICVAGNVGCAMHIQSQAEASGQPLQVLHPVELLHRAVFGTR